MTELRLDTEQAIAEATARALELRAAIRDGRYLDDDDVRLLADIACAVLALAPPLDFDMTIWLAAADACIAQPLPEPPAWLADLCGVPDA